MSEMDLASAPKTIGVSSPRSVFTATEMSAAEYWRMCPSDHDELHSGTCTAEHHPSSDVMDATYRALSTAYY